MVNFVILCDTDRAVQVATYGTNGKKNLRKTQSIRKGKEDYSSSIRVDG